jgi:hypothetical protein
MLRQFKLVQEKRHEGLTAVREEPKSQNAAMVTTEWQSNTNSTDVLGLSVLPRIRIAGIYNSEKCWLCGLPVDNPW